MRTYQDFEPLEGKERLDFIVQLITEHRSSDMYTQALIADEYDRQQNRTIREFTRIMFNEVGQSAVNYFVSNHRKASNFFNRLNTQRCAYLLGNGVGFADDEKAKKQKLGERFDSVFYNAGYYALIHGVSFPFWNMDHLYCFRVTEFAPLWDELTGQLRAGVRFWQLAPEKPWSIVLYTKNGVERFKSKNNTLADLEPVGDVKAYKTITQKAEVDIEPQIIGTENYGGRLPIVPFYGSRLKQSTLVGMRESIDAYDIISNGWFNDLRDCAEVYWIIENYGGMSAADLQRVRERLITTHMLQIDSANGGKVTPYTQEMPFQSRDAFLTRLRGEIYEDFGGVDMRSITSGNQTTTAIKAMYEALNQCADDLEMQALDCLHTLLDFAGVDGDPIFKRSMLVNELEQVQMIMLMRDVLDDETLLRHTPFITVDEIPGILERLEDAAQSRFVRDEAQNDQDDEEQDDGEDDV